MTQQDEFMMQVLFNRNRAGIEKRIKELEGKRRALVDFLIDECLPESLKELFDPFRDNYEWTEKLLNIYRNWIK